jgi:hypothetical protein
MGKQEFYAIMPMLAHRSKKRIVFPRGLVRDYFMRDSLSMVVEDPNVAVGLEWVCGDYHDSSVEMVNVLD